MSIVYELSFNSRVLVKVTPTVYIVPKDSAVTIHTDRSSIINYQGIPGLNSFTTTWDCDEKVLCANGIKNAELSPSGGSLIITYDDFLDARLEYLKPYRVRAKASGNFVFGDGGWTSEGYVDLVWIDFNSTAEIVGPKEVAVD